MKQQSILARGEGMLKNKPTWHIPKPKIKPSKLNDRFKEIQKKMNTKKP